LQLRANIKGDGCDELPEIRFERRIVRIRLERRLVHVEPAIQFDLQAVAALGRPAVAPYDLDTFQRQMAGGGRGRSIGMTFDVLRKSNWPALLNYYRANYPRPPYCFDGRSPRSIISTPTLILFGLDDPWVLADGLRDNGRWFSHPLKVVTVLRRREEDRDAAKDRHFTAHPEDRGADVVIFRNLR